LQTGGEVRVATDPATTFAFISDPFRLATCIPGCDDLRDLGGGRYGATLKNKVGFIAVKFDVVVELTKVDPPAAIDATISGNAPGLGGRLTANARVRLEPAADGTTIHYAVEMGLTGKLGGIGQPVFRAKSDELSRSFGTNLKAAIEDGSRV
jgi:hypothetical protein